jgi:hypothetical protein
VGGVSREVAHVGRFVATITQGGAGSIGVNVFVGTFAGEVVAIQASRTACERALQLAIMRILVEAAASLEPEPGEVRS